jgi:hypothetical protein
MRWTLHQFLWLRVSIHCTVKIRALYPVYGSITSIKFVAFPIAYPWWIVTVIVLTHHQDALRIVQYPIILTLSVWMFYQLTWLWFHYRASWLDLQFAFVPLPKTALNIDVLDDFISMFRLLIFSLWLVRAFLYGLLLALYVRLSKLFKSTDDLISFHLSLHSSRLIVICHWEIILCRRVDYHRLLIRIMRIIQL